MISFGEDRKRRRPNLAAMIDVVFILLVFFMLSSRLAVEHTLPLAIGGAGGSYSGPPRLVELTDAGVMLNGRAITPEALPAALARLMQAPDDAVILRASGAADLQALVALMDGLIAAGLTHLVLVE